MRVVRRVPRAIDHHHAPVRQPLVERHRGVAEDRQALATEQLQHRLTHATQGRQRRGRIRLGLELAQDRAGRGGPERPDRVRPVRREVRLAHPDHLAQERGQRPIRVARREPLAQPALDARRVIARAGRRGGALVRDDPPDGVGPQAGPERTPAAIGVTGHVGRNAGLPGDGGRDRRHVLELALDRVRGAVAGRAATPSVDGVDRERRRRAAARRRGTSCGPRMRRGPGSGAGRRRWRRPRSACRPERRRGGR